MAVRFYRDLPDTELTQERLKEVINYDPGTGVFTWRGRKGIREGRAAGCLENGYTRIRIDMRLYQAHRLAWLYVHGRWPSGQIDHEKQNRADNRIDKLRDVTPAQNCQNTPDSGRNTSGFKGVSYSRAKRKWVAQIGYGHGKHKFLGHFVEPQDAALAYAAGAAKYHTHNPAALAA